jgi:GntR family phosphonate transport system transcriptional regulator
MQPKSLSWKQIRDALAQQIATGGFAAGGKLPSEAELGAMFRAGRHSVRRALGVLAAEGRVRIEHGRGAFVQDGVSFQYTIDRRDRLFDQLERAGHRSELVALAVEERPAGPEIAAALGIGEGAPVHESRVLLMADGVPLGIGRSHHPLARFPDFRTHRRFAPTQRMFYRSYGIGAYFREDTFLWARPATPEEADLLKQQPGMPVVETRARDTDPQGSTIGFSTTVWAASRIRFVLPARR